METEMSKITDNFFESEFKCRCCGKLKLDLQLVYTLEVLRRVLNSPISITSSYRCKDHNKAVGGVTNSQHRLGVAADIQVSGKSPLEVYEAAIKLFHGVGLYDTFVHVDLRGSEVHWGSKHYLPSGPTDKQINDKLKELE